MNFTAAGEGELDLAVIQSVLSHLGHELVIAHNKAGCSKLDAALAGFANASRYSPWVVLRDQDDHDCAIDLANQKLPNRLEFPDLIFRVVQREVEAWILADRLGFASLTGVSRQLVPRQPEELADPKRHLIEIARRSRRKNIREGLAPRLDSGATVGPEYNAILQDFVLTNWSCERASEYAPGLQRFISRVQNYTR